MVISVLYLVQHKPLNILVTVCVHSITMYRNCLVQVTGIPSYGPEEQGGKKESSITSGSASPVSKASDDSSDQGYSTLTTDPYVSHSYTTYNNNTVEPGNVHVSLDGPQGISKS